MFFTGQACQIPHLCHREESPAGCNAGDHTITPRNHSRYALAGVDELVPKISSSVEDVQGVLNPLRMNHRMACSQRNQLSGLHLQGI